MIYPNNIFNPYYLETGVNGSSGLNPYEGRIFGGLTQSDRMIKDKRRTLDRVVLSSYAKALVRKNGSEDYVRALINPNKLKLDYDDKVLSVRFEAGFSLGDIIEWKETNTRWIIYLQDLTELAYFRGDIRRCSYQIHWKNENNELKSTYAAIRGPVETRINSLCPTRHVVDVPNNSLHLYIPKNKDTLAYFQRYAKFYLPDADDPTRNTCWRIHVANTINSPGIIEITAVEYYSNTFLDDIATGVVDGLVQPFEDPTPNVDIVGDSLIMPNIKYHYTYIGSEKASWVYDKKLPLEVSEDGKNIEIQWNSNYRGSFDLQYGTSTKTIIVDSLF